MNEGVLCLINFTYKARPILSVVCLMRLLRQRQAGGRLRCPWYPERPERVMKLAMMM